MTDNSINQHSSYRPNLPDWGAYLYWPEPQELSPSLARKSSTSGANTHPEASASVGGELKYAAERMGEAWIHPDDVALAKQFLPSRRVFRRTQWDGTYYHLKYGQVHLRVRPSMWFAVPPLDLEVGQPVELLARQMRNDAGIFRIVDILYEPKLNEIEYYLRGDTLRLDQKFQREDLRPLHVKHHLRAGYYEHKTPKAQIPKDVELLNVGKLTN